MNTRFNPTTNGDASKGILHLGHLYVARVNEYMAHSTGGKYLVRFDDAQIMWASTLGKAAMRANSNKIRDELEWAGVHTDGYVWQSDREADIEARIHERHPWLAQSMAYDDVPCIVRDDAPQYPYAPYLTSEVAINDAMDGVTHIIAGDELLSRYSLYEWFRRMYGLPVVRHIFIPRLKAGGELANVSKTAGNYKLDDYKLLGWSPRDLDVALRASCLIDPRGEWDWRNVKAQPRLMI